MPTTLSSVTKVHAMARNRIAIGSTPYVHCDNDFAAEWHKCREEHPLLQYLSSTFSPRSTNSSKERSHCFKASFQTTILFSCTVHLEFRRTVTEEISTGKKKIISQRDHQYLPFLTFPFYHWHFTSQKDCQLPSVCPINAIAPTRPKWFISTICPGKKPPFGLRYPRKALTTLDGVKLCLAAGDAQVLDTHLHPSFLSTAPDMELVLGSACTTHRCAYFPGPVENHLPLSTIPTPVCYLMPFDHTWYRLSRRPNFRLVVTEY